MSTTLIQDILNNGKSINDELGKKIELLATRNSNFNQQLTKRLNDIIAVIDAFKSTNLQGLTETKNKLTSVTNELETTKANLQQTQNELERVKTQLANVQTQLQTSDAAKNELEQKVKDLEEKIKQVEVEYDNKINGIRREMSDKSTQEKKALQEEYDKTIAALNNEKTVLQKQIDDAKRSETESINTLKALQQEHEGLITNLGTINQILVKQLELISSINIEQPNTDDYTSLLETIQNGLTGVIGEINRAVNPADSAASKSEQPPEVASDEAEKDRLYELFKETENKTLFYSQIPKKSMTTIQQNVYEARRGNADAIKIIKDELFANKEKADLHLKPLSGGKRRRRTMKKRQRKTRKLMKKMRGGYVYNTSKELDRASSVISKSSSSRSSSISKTKSNRKHKTRNYKMHK